MSRLIFPAIIVYDCVAKSKFNNMYSYRHLLNGIMRATDVVSGGKRSFCVRLRQCGQGLFSPLRCSTLVCSLPNVTHLCLAGVHGGFPSDRPFSVVSEIDKWECGQEFALCSPWL